MPGIGDSLGGGFKIAEAYVEFSTKGDIKQEVTDQRNSFRDAQRDMLNSKLGMEREETKISQRKERRQQREEQLTKLQEKEAKQSLEEKVKNIGRVQLAAHALGSLPFVKGAANIATAAMLGGPMGAAGQAAAAVVGYGIEGARKANPGASDRLDYQTDRLQAIIGQEFVPIIKGFAGAVEKLANLAGGSGAQLNMPQFSGFAEMRDRLQTEALRGMAEGGNGGGVGGFLRDFRDMMPLIGKGSNEMNEYWLGRRANDIIYPQHAFRSIMDVLDS